MEASHLDRMWRRHRALMGGHAHTSLCIVCSDVETSAEQPTPLPSLPISPIRPQLHPTAQQASVLSWGMPRLC